jgi:hypothetical protein
MSDTTLKMLDMASSHSARIFAQIDNAITRNMNLQLQAKEQEAAFAWKAAQFGEQVRITDHSIQQDKINNFYRGQEFAIRQQLLPLEVQSKTLELQYNKTRYQEALKKQEDDMFKELSGFADERVASEFLRTGDLNALENYTKFRAATQQDIMNGVREFDVETYDQESKRIQFTPTEVPKYDPAVSRKLQQLSPDAHKSYEHKHNPVYKTQAAGHAASFVIDGKPEDFRAFAELADEDSAAKVMANRTTVDFNQRWIDALMKDYSKASTALAAARNEKEREVAEKLILSIETKISEKHNIIDSIVNGVSTGVYDIPSQSSTTPTVEDTRIPGISTDELGSVAGPPIAGVPYEDGGENTIRTGMIGLAKAINPNYNPDTQDYNQAFEGTVLENLDAKWYYENTAELDDKSLDRTRGKIVQSIRESNKPPTRSQIESLRNLITTPVRVPLSKTAAAILDSTYALQSATSIPFGVPDSYAALEKVEHFSARGISSMPMLGLGKPTKYVVIDGSSERTAEWASDIAPTLKTKGIVDLDDIRSLAKKIKDPDQRKLVEQELMAAYIAAAFKTQIER